MKGILMSRVRLHTLGMATIACTFLALASCTKDPKIQTSETVVATPGGAMVIETAQLDATVSAVNASTRKVTLSTPDGAKINCTAGKNVNLAQIQVGDKVTATATEQLAVYLRKSGEPSIGAASAVALAADGPDRGMFMADTMEVTARVTAVDVAARKVTLQFVEGKPRTLKIGPAVNLANVKPGEDVTVRVTESLAITMVEP
jgi:Cu/Ag efflux protein CusF